MLQKIRLLYPQSDADAFEGTVECDEVYIGGKEKWKHKSMRTPHTHVSRIFFGENKETKKVYRTAIIFLEIYARMLFLFA